MDTLTREQGIDRLRGELTRLAGEDHSACEVAARHGIFCRGFAQWSLDELKERYDWIARRWPHVSRREIERIADLWQVARKEVLGTESACDTQAIEHDACMGWDEWSNADLARFIQELTGESVEVVSD